MTWTLVAQIAVITIVGSCAIGAIITEGIKAWRKQ